MLMYIFTNILNLDFCYYLNRRLTLTFYINLNIHFHHRHFVFFLLHGCFKKGKLKVFRNGIINNEPNLNK